VKLHTAISSVLCMTSCQNPDNHFEWPCILSNTLSHYTVSLVSVLTNRNQELIFTI
jgi:hypothetical protein